MESTWNPYGIVHMEWSIWNPYGIYIIPSFHIKIYYFIIVYGIHMESIWNPWNGIWNPYGIHGMVYGIHMDCSIWNP
jgi:hypothetical protein